MLREGNVITLANTPLEVAEACSGIRSLISLLTLGIVYGYFMDRRLWVRGHRASTTVPVAIVANGLRVAPAPASPRTLLRAGSGPGVLPHVFRLAGVPGRVRACCSSSPAALFRLPRRRAMAAPSARGVA